MRYEMNELMPIVARLARKYTAGDSTSISYEKAEQLMGAVLYCIREYEEQGDHAVAGREDLTAEKAYLAGAAWVEEKTKRALKLYHQILTDFDSFGQRCLDETMTKGMPEFFRWYDPIFAPQETILTLDYPVLNNLAYCTGIDCVERWLLCVKQEQQFLRLFPREDLLRILEEYDKDYEEGMDNLCEMVLSVCVKHIPEGKPVHPILRKLLPAAEEEWEDLWSYLRTAIDSAVVRRRYSVSHGTRTADDRIIEIE